MARIWPDDPGAQRAAEVAEDVAHELPVHGRRQQDEALAVERGPQREVDAHHEHADEVDQEGEPLNRYGTTPRK
jgi:hypothetical protein